MEKAKRSCYDSLYEVAAAVNSARSPESVLLSLVENTAKTLGAKGCSILLLTPDKEHLCHTAASGLSDRYIRKGLISIDQGILNALEGKPVAVSDATLDKRAKYGEPEEKEGIAAILSVPMTLREEVIGVIRVYTSEPCHFTMDDMYFVSAVANLGAIALENARLYDAVQKDYGEFRRDMLEWRAALGDEWMIGESVVPVSESGPVMPPGG